jgi:hypothetical protein
MSPSIRGLGNMVGSNALGWGRYASALAVASLECEGGLGVASTSDTPFRREWTVSRRVKQGCLWSQF